MITLLSDSDPLIWTPSAIDSLKGQVTTEIDAISTEVTTAWVNGLMPSAIRAPFKDFYDEWVAFRDQTGLWNSFWSIWGAYVDRLKGYQMRALEWRKKFESQGITFNTPEPHVTPPGIDWLAIEPYVKWSLIIGGSFVAFKYLEPFIGPLLKKK